VEKKMVEMKEEVVEEEVEKIETLP